MNRLVITVEVGGEKLTLNKLLFNTRPDEFPAIADLAWKDMLTALTQKFV